VRNGTTGRVVSPGDPVALADAIALLMASRRLRARMGAAARRRAEMKFDQRRASLALARLFAESGRASRGPQAHAVASWRT
jgi:glycosyltransferase involved in cell wall biosynthesis